MTRCTLIVLNSEENLSRDLDLWIIPRVGDHIEIGEQLVRVEAVVYRADGKDQIDVYGLPAGDLHDLIAKLKGK